MRRGFAVLLAACSLALVLATSALAQSYPPPVSPAVEAANGGQDGSAFTGGDLGIAMVAGVVFLGVSVVTLVVARRRAGRFLGEPHHEPRTS